MFPLRRVFCKISTPSQHQGPRGNSASQVLIQSKEALAPASNHTIASCSPPLPSSPAKMKANGGLIWHSPALENFSKIVSVPFLLSPRSLIIPGRRTVDALICGDSSRKINPVALESCKESPRAPLLGALNSLLPLDPLSPGINSRFSTAQAAQGAGCQAPREGRGANQENPVPPACPSSPLPQHQEHPA